MSDRITASVKRVCISLLNWKVQGDPLGGMACARKKAPPRQSEQYGNTRPLKWRARLWWGLQGTFAPEGLPSSGLSAPVRGHRSVALTS